MPADLHDDDWAAIEDCRATLLRVLESLKTMRGTAKNPKLAQIVASYYSHFKAETDTFLVLLYQLTEG